MNISGENWKIEKSERGKNKKGKVVKKNEDEREEKKATK